MAIKHSVKTCVYYGRNCCYKVPQKPCIGGRYINVRIVTWNVATKDPPKDFTRLLNLDAKVLPDLYAIGLQELKAFPAAIVSDAVTDDPWTVAVGEQLFKRDFVRVKSVRMVGIHLGVYVKRKHLYYVTNTESEYTRTGPWGIKGGVSIRLDLYGVNVCFVNCHLSAHMSGYGDRLQDYDEIIEGHSFRDEQCKNILDHDYVFWFGDLNFRVDQFTRREIETLISKRDYDALLKQDQLRNAMNSGLILVDFQEGPIYFQPTYKFDKRTDTYDSSGKQRKPAWCDRILWLVHEDSFEGVDLSVSQGSYTSLMEYTLSDHKPVIGDFVLKVLEYPDELPVFFEPLHSWCSSKDAKVMYSVLPSLSVSKWDWVGLYKKSFTHPKDYVTYIWTPEKTTPDKDGFITYEIEIDKNYLKELLGFYQLGYFSSEKNCLVGYSNVFNITLTEESSSSDSSSDEEQFNTQTTQKKIN